MSVIGTILGVIAIGLVFWLRKDQKTHFDLHEGDIYTTRHAYEALMSDFNNYQVKTDRKIVDLEKQLKIKTGSTERQIDKINKSLPSVIRTVVGHIEFARPLDKK